MNRPILVAALLIASCSRSERPQAPTEAETERLNDAEEMLNDLANEEGGVLPGTAASSDSN